MDDMPELYLTGPDTARWLGIPIHQLKTLTTALGIEACEGKVGGMCRFRKADLKELKACAGIMAETGVNASAAAKVRRALQARAAAKQAEAAS